MSVGSEEDDLIGPAWRFADALRAREYEGLAFESHVFDEETHVSVFPAALSRGLRFLYAEALPSGH